MLKQEYLQDDPGLIKTYSDSGYFVVSNTGNMYSVATDMACFILNKERSYTESNIRIPALQLSEENEADQDVLTAYQSLDNIKRLKINYFKDRRDREEESPIDYNGTYFDFDAKARDRITGAITALDVQGGTGTIQWTTADNRHVDVGLSDLRMIVGLAAMRASLLHTKYGEKKEAVNACETAEEVAAILWEDQEPAE